MNTKQRGITGLETAIILIAFVVVASVFAFTVLSTGVFWTDRARETIFAGLEQTKSSLRPTGSVIASVDTLDRRRPYSSSASSLKLWTALIRST